MSCQLTTIAYPADLVAEYRRLNARASISALQVRQLAVEALAAEARVDEVGYPVPDVAWDGFLALIEVDRLHATFNRMIESLGTVVP